MNKNTSGINLESARVICKLTADDNDRRTLAAIPLDPRQQADDFKDYSKVVVRKPWGYEYLIFQNSSATVWILFIKPGFQTSLHCHPRKKTSIVVLSGEAACATLDQRLARHPAQGMLLGEGVFHRTTALSQEGTFVMEIETPVNKRDLVRFQDDYGRENLGYESADHLSANLQNYNYISFIDQNVYYNTKRRFGQCSIELMKFADSEKFNSWLASARWDIISVLQGQLTAGAGRVLRPGDMLVAEEAASFKDLRASADMEIIVIKKSDTTTRLADFVIGYLQRKNIREIFFVPETANAHLTDAIGRETSLRAVALQTEGAAVLAAEAYAKLTLQPAAVIIGSGAAATQALTGVSNAWIDSTPMLIISGQSRASSFGPPPEGLRQLANKEIDIISMAQPVTKYAKRVSDLLTVKQEIDQALAEATRGRHGPVWLDIPIDVLGTNIDETEFLNEPVVSTVNDQVADLLKTQVAQVLETFKSSRRPVILAGHGIRAAGAQREFIQLAELLNIPVLTSRRGIDLLAEDFSWYFGRPGTYGQRAANFIIQNADCLLAIGSRLSFPLIGRNHRSFARAARKIIVDVDAAELKKPTVVPDLAISADAGTFINELARQAAPLSRPVGNEWTERCRSWRKQFPVSRELAVFVLQGLNPYRLVEELSAQLTGEDVIVVGGGVALDFVMQSFKVKDGQRIISSPGLEYPGFSLPAAIGSALGAGGRRVICLCEKRGFFPNISELQTIIFHQWPVKIFVFDSKVNPKVQGVQSAYFGGRYVGDYGDQASTHFNLTQLVQAYQVPVQTIDQDRQISEKLKQVLAQKGPAFGQVILAQDCELIPRMVFTVKPDGQWISKPIEDMYPFLEREEFKRNMLIDPWPED